MYIGNDLQIAHPSYKIIDDISSGFNGSTTSFALQVNGATPVPFPISTQQVMISVNGVVQEPDPSGSAGFKLLGSNIVFSSAPANGHAFFGVINAGADYVTAGSEFPDGSATSPSFTFQDDQDTGWFRSSSGAVGYSANGVQTLTFDGNGLTVTGDASFVGDSSKNLLWDKSDGALEFADDAKIKLGTGGDLEIFHDGSNSVIADTGSGVLQLRTSGFRVNNAANNESQISADEDGSVDLFHNGNKKLETYASGIYAYGTVAIQGAEDSDAILEMFADEGDDAADKWRLRSRTNGYFKLEQYNGSAWETSLEAVGGGETTLFHNSVKILETSSSGVIVYGTESGNGDIFLYADEGDDDADKWNLKALTDGTFQIKNKSTGSWVTGLTLDGSNNATFAGTVSDSKGDLRNIPANVQTSAVTLAASDAGKVVATSSGGWVIPASTFSTQGMTVTLLNRSNSDQTINASALTYLWNTADGVNVKASTLTLGARTMATLWFDGADTGYIQAAALTVS